VKIFFIEPHLTGVFNEVIIAKIRHKKQLNFYFLKEKPLFAINDFDKIAVLNVIKRRQE